MVAVFTDFYDRIGRLTTSGVITYFVLTSGAGPRGITRGPDGAVWFTETNVGKILRDAERLHYRQDHGQVAGPLRDLTPPQLAFLLQFFERGNYYGEQLQNNRRGDIRHDAEREDGQAPEHSAAEQIDETEQGALIPLEKVG